MGKYIIAAIMFVLSGALNAQIKMLYDKEASEKERLEVFLNSGSSNILIFRIDEVNNENEADTSLILKIEVIEDKKTIKEVSDESTVVTSLNASGNIAFREIYDKAGKLSGKTVYTYNNSGDIVKRELYFGSMKAGEEVYEFKRINSGNMKFYGMNDIVMGSSSFQFNPEGKLSEEIIYGQDGNVEQKYEYVYDSEGRLAEERVILRNEQKSFKNYSYDEYNNLVEEISKDGNGNVLSLNRYAYDGKYKIEEIQHGKDLRMRIQYFYKEGMPELVKYTDLSDMSVYYWKYVYEK